MTKAAISLTTVVVVLIVSASAQSKSLSDTDACRLFASLRKANHIGETIVFRGEFTSDYMERSIIRPVGCHYGRGIGSMDSQSENTIDRLAPSVAPSGKYLGVRATFTTTIVQGERNGMLYANDDGIRLNVSRAEHAVSFVWKP